MAEVEWVCFTRRTNDPKLRYLQNLLDARGIANRRNGKSFWAPRLEVHASQLDLAWIVLDEIGDNTPDDDPRFTDTEEYEDPSDYIGMGWLGKDGQP